MATIHASEAGARPEYQLLKRCCRTELTEAEWIAHCLGDERLDWGYLVALAGYHGVQPLLYYHLRNQDEQLLSEPHMTWLRGVVGARSAHSLVLMHELGRLTEVFEREALPVLAVKGAVLAESVYGSAAVRPFLDVDLIVRRSDFGRIERLLERDGYDSKELNPFQKVSYLYVHGQYTFWRRIKNLGEAQAFLDVHTAIMPPGYAYAEDFGALWGRAVTAPIAGRPVPTLGREDLLLVLCYHGFKNRWERLKYVCDLAVLLRATPELDWDAVYRRAEAMNSRRVLDLGLLLAADLLGVDLPRWVREGIRQDHRVRTLGWSVTEWLPRQAHVKVEPYWDRVQLNVLGQDGLRGGLRYGAYAAARRVAELYLPPDD